MWLLWSRRCTSSEPSIRHASRDTFFGMAVEYDRVGSLHRVTFEPSQLGIVASSRDRSGTYVPMRLAQAMSSSEVVAALDGPMFSTCDSAGYSTSRCADPRFAQYDAGPGVIDLANPGEASKGITLSVRGGAARWSRSSATLPDADVVVQLYPSLVEDGRVVSVSTSGSNASRVWRAAVAQYRDGRLAFVVGVETLAGFAQALAQSGAVWAGYTDGGGSTALGMRGIDPSAPISRWGSSEDRPVAVFLVAKARARASGPSGLSPLAKAALSGVAVAAAALAAQQVASLPAVRRAADSTSYRIKSLFWRSR